MFLNTSTFVLHGVEIHFCSFKAHSLPFMTYPMEVRALGHVPCVPGWYSAMITTSLLARLTTNLKIVSSHG